MSKATKLNMIRTIWQGALITILLSISSSVFAANWRTVSGETYTLLWKDLTYTELQIDSRQAKPAGLDILDTSYAKQIIIEYKVEVSADRFRKMTLKALDGAYSEQELSAAAEDIKRFCSWYLGVEKGDHYRLTWLPDQGLGLYLNDKQLGVIASPESAALILSVWLGRAAVSEDQRDTMLAEWREASLGV